MKLILLAGIVLFVEDVIPAGDVDVGDVIVFSDADDPVLVNRVRLGQGGLIFTVTSDSSGSPEEDRPVKLTAEVRLRRRGRDMARQVLARRTRRAGVSPTVPSSGRYDDIASVQPAERDDPLDPQRILDDLPADEHGFFLDQHREAVDTARDPAGQKQLRRVLRLWRFHADAAGDPVTGRRCKLPGQRGMALEDAVRVYRPAS